MADEQNATSATPVDFCFPMHLCDERTGRVDRQKITIPRFGGDGFGDAMGRAMLELSSAGKKP